MFRILASLALVAALLAVTPANAACDADAVQDSGSIYRICMPEEGSWNGSLVMWAHGFQDAGTPVEIPESQLCFADICLDELITSLGFAFATNSYSKTGLAIVQGQADLLDLIDIFTEQYAAPQSVYMTGASEGGIITTLLAENHPDRIAGGLAACGPVGSFEEQINYFGNARATFEVFWPGLIPGDPFAPSQDLIDMWGDYYSSVVRPTLLAEPRKLREWQRVARLPFDELDYEATAENSAQAVLRYAVLNLLDAQEVLGGFPYDNDDHIFINTDVPQFVNTQVMRVSADPAAVTEMNASYDTTGVLEIPLVTIHTTRDEQVPAAHEVMYIDKTTASGAFGVNHIDFRFERYGHCNFTADEALLGFSVMLDLAGEFNSINGIGHLLGREQLARFETRAREYGLNYRVGGAAGVTR